MKKISIRDVAREAGVSITTVSRALNGYSDVSKKTKEKILEIVERLEYAPDANARAMGSKETTTIGLLLSDLVTYRCQWICPWKHVRRLSGMFRI